MSYIKIQENMASREAAFLITMGTVLSAAAAKFIQFRFMPPKYFYDSVTILNMMDTAANASLRDSYGITAVLSGAINLFGMDSLLQWSLFYAAIFNIILILVFRRFQLEHPAHCLWVWAAVGVLNLTVFNLGKDAFQFALFLIIYTVLSSRQSEIKKALLSFVLLFIWGATFRVYYMLIAIYSLIAFVIISFIKKQGICSIFVFFTALLAGVFISLVFALIFLPEEYEIIINTHKNLFSPLEGSEDALTVISDVFDSGGLLIYMLNYFLNLLRLMFPVEQIFMGGLKYLLYAAYQGAVSLMFIRALKLTLTSESASMNRNSSGKAGARPAKRAVRASRGSGSPPKISHGQTIAVSIYAGFLLGSSLFEPAFGSWIRHGATVFPILLVAFFKRKAADFVEIKEPYIASRYIKARDKIYAHKSKSLFSEQTQDNESRSR